VGTIEPRKNIEILLKSWGLLRQRIDNAPALVLCGHYGWKTAQLQERIAAGEREGWLHHLGYVSDEQLATLYEEAALVMFPSLYEGFGLPAVEALWAGTPLVCSDIPVLHEVAGEAALYAPVDRPDLLAEAAANLLLDSDLRQLKIGLGRQRASQLSWSRAADKTVAVWFEAAAQRNLE
jgi:alpha-1,3-rhamnosyl/mannosyltransferase